MGIFTRFRDIVSANINSMLDRAEDPEKMIKLMISEMEDTLIELKASCASVIAGKKQSERKLEELNSKQQLWAERAELAVNRGKDNLAREALLEKRRYSELAEAMQAEISELSALIRQYQDDIEELEEKLRGAKEKKQMLVERQKRASSKKRAQQDIRRSASAETMARFDRMESRIERMEAEADLVNPRPRTRSVEEEFEDLATDADIEDELARLKNQREQQAARNGSGPESTMA